MSTGYVGEQVLPAGLQAGLVTRQGVTGEVMMSELHGRFYEQAYRNRLFSAGSTTTALSANTITLTASSTPIVGVWNPLNSPVNLVLLQGMVSAFVNTLTTPVGPGAFVIASSVGNAVITTGAAPFNRKTLTTTGSQARAFNGGVALTGLTNNLTIIEGLDQQVAASGQTWGTITAPTVPGNLPYAFAQSNFDGQIIVPPGGVFAIYNTTSTTTVSVTSRLLWEEVPV